MKRSCWSGCVVSVAYVLGESIAAFAPLERLGRDVLSILLVGKEPAKEHLEVPRREPAKLDTEQAIVTDRRGWGVLRPVLALGRPACRGDER